LFKKKVQPPIANTQDKKSKKSPSGIILNIFIVMLAGIVLFMSYSIYLKVSSSNASTPEDQQRAAEIVQLEVLNGCGTAGIAEKFTDFLRTRNFDVVSRGNYRSFDIDNSFVIDRTGNVANAEKVADVLGINRKYIVQQTSNEYFLDVSLVIGRDFNNLTPLK
jgi:Na+-transporting NADH:ubiquinone oxidoreductase subunit NqrC